MGLETPLDASIRRLWTAHEIGLSLLLLFLQLVVPTVLRVAHPAEQVLPHLAVVGQALSRLPAADPRQDSAADRLQDLLVAQLRFAVLPLLLPFGLLSVFVADYIVRAITSSSWYQWLVVGFHYLPRSPEPPA